MDIDGTPLFAMVTATPLSTPIVLTGGTMISQSVYRVKSNAYTGQWAMALQAGDYRLQFDYNNSLSPTTLQISVPDGSGTASVDTLTSSALAFIYRQPPAVIIQGSFVAGKFNIPNAVSSGAVTGLALGYTPTSVALTVQSPSSNVLIPALTSTPTSDGFAFALSGTTDSANYKLCYLVAPANGSSSGVFSIPSGASGGTITGLGLAFTPSSVVLTVRAPSTGFVLGACVTSLPSTDGWNFALTGLTDSSAYILNWIAFP